jgi:hypothetical protein
LLGSGNERNAERAPVQSFMQNLLGQFGATAATGGTTGAATEFRKRIDAIGHGGTNGFFGNSVTNANVHGLGTKKEVPIVKCKCE